MILKYRTMRDGSIEQWNYIDEISEASTYLDKTDSDAPVPVVYIVKKDMSEMGIALHHEAYLLNDYGTTVEKIRM